MNRKHTPEENQKLRIDRLKRRIDCLDEMYLEYRDKYFYGMEEKNKIIQEQKICIDLLRDSTKPFEDSAKHWQDTAKFWREQSTLNNERANLYLQQYNEEIRKRYSEDRDEGETIAPDEEINRPIEQMTEEEINRLIEEKRKGK
jgi:hypothetical protein